MSEKLLQPVTAVKGIGAERAQELSALRIQTVLDLLEHFPYRYEDYRVRDLAEAEEGEKITIIGRVYGEPAARFFGKKKSKLSVKVVVDNVVVTAIWFNRHFLKNQLQAGREIMLSGKFERSRLQLVVSEHHFMDTGKVPVQEGSIQPVYSTVASVQVKQIRKWIATALEQFGDEIDEILPGFLLQKYRLMTRREAIRNIHYPASIHDGKQGRRRLAFEELLLFQLKMQAYHAVNRQTTSGIPQKIAMDRVGEFVHALPFPLTNAQKRVVKEILTDMRAQYSMNRLLQGDVGSGKTVVAAIALFAAVSAGFQGALMVPTEILAEQHYGSLRELLEPWGIEVALLSGSATVRQRRDILAGLQSGMTNVVVGTHALIQEDVYFDRLGLVITDEQHRFGVEQRRILREKGLQPDVLFMTATPIPRTLAITAFGDMDVSTIDELPAGRKPIETYFVRHAMLDRVLSFVRKELEKGRQAYVISPLIEESEKLDLQNAIDVHTQLTHYFGGEFKVGLMHGRLPSREKDEVMQQFSRNEIHVLVSTTVVEVGVNVPNASVMVIYDAERFGLAQLHQLRGRVGRGAEQSYCILIADPKSEVGKERMRIMTETNDGFEVARRDLELRGPGDFFGTKQSGLPEFKIADVVQDYRMLEVAREEAAALIGSKRFWKEPEYSPLRRYLRQDEYFLEKIKD
ncbi:ATP-dependent DNA helicase RecG [Aneurinibacillus tyrosinisolvens]|uniref:ATP-dependent DNA helicase RecG n=1 Tax=Aneurinibacillus tyrosinisolvens TaxID=1443435 RepID=UPI00063FB5AD|nr:ATP-dependent DNA helicase RecG [Aneurinibacillus tyrosinisolvens]